MKNKKFVTHFKRWNRWRKNCLNSGFYKLLVLLGLARSYTFELDFDDYDWWRQYDEHPNL